MEYALWSAIVIERLLSLVIIGFWVFLVSMFTFAVYIILDLQSTYGNGMEFYDCVAKLDNGPRWRTALWKMLRGVS